MPRASSASGSSHSISRPITPRTSMFASSTAKSSSPARAQAQASAPITQTSQSRVEQPGFFSNMWQGFGLGTGQAIAHNLFRSNPVTSPDVTHTNEIPVAYTLCMKERNDFESCKEFLNTQSQSK